MITVQEEKDRRRVSANGGLSEKGGTLMSVFRENAPEEAMDP